MDYKNLNLDELRFYKKKFYRIAKKELLKLDYKVTSKNFKEILKELSKDIQNCIIKAYNHDKEVSKDLIIPANLPRKKDYLYIKYIYLLECEKVLLKTKKKEPKKEESKALTLKTVSLEKYKEYLEKIHFYKELIKDDLITVEEIKEPLQIELKKEVKEPKEKEEKPLSKNDEFLAETLYNQAINNNAPWMDERKTFTYLKPKSYATNKEYTFKNGLLAGMVQGLDNRFITPSYIEKMGYTIAKNAKSTFIVTFGLKNKKEIEKQAQALKEMNASNKDEVLTVALIEPQWVAVRQELYNLDDILDHGQKFKPSLEMQIIKELKNYDLTPDEKAILQVQKELSKALNCPIKETSGTPMSCQSGYGNKAKFWIMLPNIKTYNGLDKILSTTIHEFAHHIAQKEPKRFDFRKGSFGSKEGANEELRAELTAYFVCTQNNIDYNPSNNFSYLKSWLGKTDKASFLKAVKTAEKRAKYLNKIIEKIDLKPLRVKFNEAVKKFAIDKKAKKAS